MLAGGKVTLEEEKKAVAASNPCSQINFENGCSCALNLTNKPETAADGCSYASCMLEAA